MSASSFREAVRAKILAEVKCPRCPDAVNIPGRSLTIEVDLETDTAICTQCGHGGPLKTFNRNSQKEK